MVDDWVIKTMYATKRRRKNNRTDDQQSESQHNDRSHSKSSSTKRYQSQQQDILATGEYLCDMPPANFCDPQLSSDNNNQNHLQLFPTLPHTGIPLESGQTQLQAIPQQQAVKSNPSKRHRERLNAELERLASLLPFDESVIVKLDKLSILRLAVSYLRMKCYFQTITQERNLAENRLVSHLYHFSMDLNPMEGEACLQALNGFVFIVSCDGEVFSVSQTVESYLGFHQSDILHQSVMELIHSEDREEFKRQLSWKQMLPDEHRNCSLKDLMTPKYCHLLQRCFTVRFRCLLDNTSGFITLEMSGRLQFLLGQTQGQINEKQNSSRGQPNHATYQTSSEMPSYDKCPLGLFAVCSPLGPMPSLDAAHRDLTFKTKHNLDLGIINMDNRARMMFLFKESDPVVTVYHYLHPDDVSYVSKGHREVMKSGSIGLLVHRWLNKTGSWIWLQSRIKLAYKNGSPDHALAIHRQLGEEEGRELYLRRNNEYKLPFPLLEPETLLGDEDIPMDSLGKASNQSGLAGQLPTAKAGIPSNGLLDGQTKISYGQYLDETEKCVQPKLNKKSLNSYSVSNQNKDSLSSNKKRKNTTTNSSTYQASGRGQKSSFNMSQPYNNNDSTQYFSDISENVNKIQLCQSQTNNSNIYNNLYNFNSSTINNSSHGLWFDHNYENNNNIFSPNPTDESNQNYPSNTLNEDCSAAWLAVVAAAAASKYQANGHSNGNFDEDVDIYKKCQGKSPFDYSQTFPYHQHHQPTATGTNYTDTNTTNYIANNNNPYHVFDYAPNHQNNLIHTNHVNIINTTASGQPFMTTEANQQQQDNTNTTGNTNEKSDLSSFLLQNVHNLSGSASSTDSIGSSEILNSSYQSKLPNDFGTYSNLVKQVIDGNELKNAVHIPVVRRTWNDIDSLSTRGDSKIEDQMMNTYNPTAMFTT